jgi:hypothetical protein
MYVMCFAASLSMQDQPAHLVNAPQSKFGLRHTYQKCSEMAFKSAPCEVLSSRSFRSFIGHSAP